jgi:phage anti-repressor protein
MSLSKPESGPTALPERVQRRVEDASAPSIDEWLADHLSDRYLHLYKELMQARYTSQEKYPVEFISLATVLGYKSMESPREQLLRRYGEGVDYISLRLEPKRQVHGGQNLKNYALTLKCAQLFALNAGTDQGHEVRDFFVETLAVVQDYHLLTTLLSAKAKLAKEQEQEAWNEHWRLLEDHGEDRGTYAGEIGNGLCKAGRWDKDLTDRVRDHKKTFPMFRLFHVEVFENPYLLERKFLDDPEVSRHKVKYERKLEIVQLGPEGLSKSGIKRIMRKHRLQLEGHKAKGIGASDNDVVIANQVTEQARLAIEQTRLAIEQAKGRTEQLKLEIELEKLRKMPPIGSAGVASMLDKRASNGRTADQEQQTDAVPIMATRDVMTPTRAESNSSQEQTGAGSHGATSQPVNKAAHPLEQERMTPCDETVSADPPDEDVGNTVSAAGTNAEEKADKVPRYLFIFLEEWIVKTDSERDYITTSEILEKFDLWCDYNWKLVNSKLDGRNFLLEALLQKGFCKPSNNQYGALTKKVRGNTVKCAFQVQWSPSASWPTYVPKGRCGDYVVARLVRTESRNDKLQNADVRLDHACWRKNNGEPDFADDKIDRSDLWRELEDAGLPTHRSRNKNFIWFVKFRGGPLVQ